MNVVKRKPTSLKKASREPHFKSPKWKNQIKKKGPQGVLTKIEDGAIVNQTLNM
jgi:hypothetical protein